MVRAFTYYYRVFGCQMNVADAHDLGARLEQYGGRAVGSPAEADLVLVNTCMVRAKAEDKALSYFGELKHLKGSGADRKMLVGLGCVVRRSRERILKAHPHLDLLLDYSDPDGVLEALSEHFPPLQGVTPTADFTPLYNAADCRQHFVTAIRGCHHGCSYCVVPLARGPQRDVPLGRIVAEARALEATGAPDLTVLGQNILSYGTTSGDRTPRFIEMMEALLLGTEFPWITFLTSLPTDLTEEICDRVIAHPRVTPLLHLPLQAGSDRVLAAMKRGHNLDHYRGIIEYARRVRPDLYLTTDLLVGFPTETEEDFQATLRAAEEIGFDDAFMFAYSERPGTLASRKYKDELPRAEKLRRLNDLIARQREWGAARNARYLGRELDVIIERIGGDDVTARTAFNKPVHLAATRRKPGQYSRVRITESRVSSFSGEECD